jgi:hypothetical protein
MNGSITLNAQLTIFITSLFIPLVVGIITKYNAPALVKFIVNAVISTGASLINTSINESGVAVIGKASAVTALYTIVISTLTYLSLYKPLDINAKLLPEVGVNVPLAKAA